MNTIPRRCSICGTDNPPQAASCLTCGQTLKTTAPLLEETAIASPDNVLAPNVLLKQRYRILGQVGQGGFGAIYKAEDTQFDNRLVAIKEIRLSGLKPHEMIEAVETFNREARLLANLKHPQLPRLYDSFSKAECWYTVLSFIEGRTLEQHLNTVSTSPDTPAPGFAIEEVLRIGIQLCTVLDYLHTQEPPIIFRDLKPANIMLTSGGRVCLIDFGIARRFKVGQAKDTIPFGSPGYAAPEQYGKAQTTIRSDIYSLGATLHQLLTGEDPSLTPFRFTPLHWQDSSILADLEKLILQMVELDASKRPESATVIKQELERIADRLYNRQQEGLQPQALPLSQPLVIPQPSIRFPPPPPPSSGQQAMLMQQPVSSGKLHLNTSNSTAHASWSWTGSDDNIPASTPRLTLFSPKLGIVQISDDNIPASTPQPAHWTEILSVMLTFANFIILFTMLFLLDYSSPPSISHFFLILLATTAILAVIFGRIARQRTPKRKSALADLSLAISSILAVVYVCLILGFLLVLLFTWLGWYPFLLP